VLQLYIEQMMEGCIMAQTNNVANQAWDSSLELQQHPPTHQKENNNDKIKITKRKEEKPLSKLIATYIQHDWQVMDAHGSPHK